MFITSNNHQDLTSCLSSILFIQRRERSEGWELEDWTSDSWISDSKGRSLSSEINYMCSNKGWIKIYSQGYSDDSMFK